MQARYRNALVASAVLAAALLFLAVGCNQLEQWFGPPARELQETYTEKEGGPRVDHALLDKVLAEHVTGKGLVRYARLVENSAPLDTYIRSLARIDFAALGRDEKLALLINAYNACTLRLILDHWPLASIRDIPEAERWKKKRWQVGSMLLSLDEIEHEYLRGRFKEPRIHFAVNCASIGCPPLRAEAYRGDRIEEQLQQQAKRVHTDPAHVELRANATQVRLTRLYLWFEGDFQQVAGSVLRFVARFVPDLKIELDAGREPAIDWIEYDWSINAAR